MDQKKYEINGKIYFQKALVLGQIADIIPLLENRFIDDLSAVGLVTSLGDILPELAAVILIPEGTKISERDLEAMKSEFQNEMSLDTALEVAADFLSFNPVSSFFTRLKNLTGAIVTGMMGKETGSAKS